MNGTNCKPYPHLKKSGCEGRFHQNLNILYPNVQYDCDISDNKLYVCSKTRKDDLDLCNMKMELSRVYGSRNLVPVLTVLKHAGKKRYRNNTLSNNVSCILSECYSQCEVNEIRKEMRSVINDRSLVNKECYFMWILRSLHKKNADGLIPRYTLIRCLLLLQSISDDLVKEFNRSLDYPYIYYLGHIDKSIKHNALYICIFGFKIEKSGRGYVIHIICKGGMTIFPERRDIEHTKTTFSKFKKNEEYFSFKSYDMIIFPSGNITDSENLVFRLLKENGFYLTSKGKAKLEFHEKYGSNEMFSVKINLDQRAKISRTVSAKQAYERPLVFLEVINGFCRRRVLSNRRVMGAFHECALSKHGNFRSFSSILLTDFILLLGVIKTEVLRKAYEETKLDLKQKNERICELKNEVCELKETIEQKDQMFEKIFAMLPIEKQEEILKGLEE